MDRPIIYTQEQIRGYDLSKGWQDAFSGLGQEAADVLGQTTTVVAGLPGTASSPASLVVNVGPGSIYAQGILDPSPEGDLPADGSTRSMQGVSWAAQPLTFSTAALSSGQSQWALIEVIFAFSDVVRTGDPSAGVLPFYNSANPSSPLQGQGGSGAVLNTEHSATVSLKIKYGTPATTGSQTPPSADTGYVGLYLILLTFGQTQITQGEILIAGPSAGTGVPSNYPLAPFLAGLLNQHHKGIAGQAPQIDLTSEVKNILPYANLPAANSAIFISSGTFTPTKTGNHLIIAMGGGGGGGGGGGSSAGSTLAGAGGQGGQGGSITFTLVALTAGTVYPVTIGAGGNKGVGVSGAEGTSGTSGAQTELNSVSYASGGLGGLPGYFEAGGSTVGTFGTNGSGPGGGVGGAWGNVGGGSGGNGGNAGIANGPGSGGGGGGGGGAAGSSGAATTGGDGANGTSGVMAIVW